MIEWDANTIVSVKWIGKKNDIHMIGETTNQSNQFMVR